MAEERKRMKPLQMAFLLLLLVVLPAGSWFYLNGGYKHRKAALEELQELGTVGDFALTDQNGRLFTSEDLKQRVGIVAFLPADEKQQDQWIAHLARVQEQFDDRDDVCFLLFADSSSIPDTRAFAASHQLTDTLQWVLLSGASGDLQQMASRSFYLPQGQDNQPDYHFAALVDDSTSMVRRHYDLLDNQQLGRLVEHLTIVMPRLPDPDIILKRDKEK